MLLVNLISHMSQAAVDSINSAYYEPVRIILLRNNYCKDGQTKKSNSKSNGDPE